MMAIGYAQLGSVLALVMLLLSCTLARLPTQSLVCLQEQRNNYVYKYTGASAAAAAAAAAAADGAHHDDDQQQSGVEQADVSAAAAAEAASAAAEAAGKIDVVLVHGLQLKDYREAYHKTWRSSGAACSLPACIKADFPQARVLSVSYNSTAANWTNCEVLSGQGSWAHVAAAVCQHLADPTFKVDPPLGKAPLFLVGHSLGGLLIKQLCLELKKQADNQSGGNNYSKVFDSIHGAVFYATPHMGSWFGNHAERLLCCLPCFKQSSVLPLLRVFSQETAEVNAAFHNMLPGCLPRQCRCLGKIVPKASAMAGADNTESIEGATHSSICKPRSCSDASYLTLRSFINHEMGRPRPREHNGSAAVAGSSSAAAGPAAAAAAPAAAGSDQPAAGGSSSARQQLWIAPGRAVELQVFDLQVDIVSDQVPWKRVGQLQCIIQSAPSDTESSFTCELCGTIPVGDNFWLNSSSGSGFEADLSLTAAIGPAVSPQFVEVLSLSLADLDVMVRSKFHGDLYSNELCVTVVSSRKPFQLTDHLHGTLQWAWLVRHEAYSVNSKVELTWVELALGGISRTWQRGEQM